MDTNYHYLLIQVYIHILRNAEISTGSQNLTKLSGWWKLFTVAPTTNKWSYDLKRFWCHLGREFIDLVIFFAKKPCEIAFFAEQAKPFKLLFWLRITFVRVLNVYSIFINVSVINYEWKLLNCLNKENGFKKSLYTASLKLEHCRRTTNLRNS